MSEIERAIEYIEDMFPIDEQEGEALSTALKALRAELERKKNPLTMEDVVSEAYDRGYNLGYSDGYQDGTRGEGA